MSSLIAKMPGVKTEKVRCSFALQKDASRASFTNIVTLTSRYYLKPEISWLYVFLGVLETMCLLPKLFYLQDRHFCNQYELWDGFKVCNLFYPALNISFIFIKKSSQICFLFKATAKSGNSFSPASSQCNNVDLLLSELKTTFVAL